MNEFFDHVLKLCEQHNIAVYIHPECRPCSFPPIRQINIHPVKSVEDYCVALHEIGHVILGHLPEQDRMEKETSAWWWAINNALEWDIEHTEFLAKCLALWEEECKLTP